jgi:DNA-binding GntR family transcriptional regulator
LPPSRSASGDGDGPVIEGPVASALPGGGGAVEAQSLADGVYRKLRRALMRSEMKPHQRLKIREVAAALGTSETPVREAIFQLVRDGAVELRPRYYVRVRRLSLAEYLEIRDVRLHLEPLAAERALPNFAPADIDDLRESHRRLIEAERSGRFREALDENFAFHFGIYWRSGMPIVINLIETLWMQVGPLLNDLYPFAAPTYIDRHQHENILDALERRDPFHLREAIKQDTLEGGRNLVNHLRAVEQKGMDEAASDLVSRDGRGRVRAKRGAG